MQILRFSVNGQKLVLKKSPLVKALDTIAIELISGLQHILSLVDNQLNYTT